MPNDFCYDIKQYKEVLPMRYLLQIFVMLAEVGIIVVAGFMIYENPREPLTWALVILGYMAWEDVGGFMAWNPQTIKEFLANAKKAGL